MTSIRNQKAVTALAAISAIAAVLIGSVHMALAADDNITKIINNKGVNVQTDTNQKQDCQTAGETSPISNSCTATSTDTVTQSGGILKK
ncbi:MAG: hypothetical protein WAK17_18210 [Candidatus Nitrosopolaris sp.]|jgi:hypothetical protein